MKIKVIIDVYDECVDREDEMGITEKAYEDLVGSIDIGEIDSVRQWDD